MCNNRGDYNMKRFLLLSLCFLIIFISGCTIDNKIEMTKESIIEEPAPVVEENITEDLTMELKPIKLFSNYVVSPNAVYGIDGVGLEKIEAVDEDETLHPFTQFFKIGNDIYFSVSSMETGNPISDTDPVQYETIEVIHYFKQKGKVLTELDEADFPSPPTSEHILFQGGNYKIEKTTFNIDGVDTDISDVHNGSPHVTYLEVNGCALTDKGLWFSVSTTIKTRYEGIYFWSLKGAPNRVLNVGRIY